MKLGGVDDPIQRTRHAKNHTDRISGCRDMAKSAKNQRIDRNLVNSAQIAMVKGAKWSDDSADMCAKGRLERIMGC